MASLEDIEAAALKVSREHLAGHVDRVIAVREQDFDGDSILSITVVTTSIDRQGIDAENASGLTRHLRSELERLGEFDFPILSFLDKSEFKSLEPEAA